MDVVEAIMTRRSVRAFKPTPVPQKLLEEVLEIALRAPSTDNTQPWEFAIATGQVLEEMKQTLAARMGPPDGFNPDIPFPVLSYQPPYKDRSKSQGRRLFEALGIARDDWDRRYKWLQYMARFCDAPVGMIMYVERYLGSYAILDAGLFLENFILTALSYGLGTCVEMAVVLYPDVLRQTLNIPESKLILCGVAVGYPDEENPSYKFRSEREPLDSFASWFGFDESA